MSASWARGLHLALLVLSTGPWLYLALYAAGALPSFAAACSFSMLTGDPCPLCGTSRAVLSLLSGDVSGSLAQTPLGLGLLLAALTQPIYRLLRVRRPLVSWREELLIDGAGLAWLAAVLLLAAC